MDEKNLILGTFQFRFHATLPALTPELPSVYTTSNFGELTNGMLKPSADLKKVFGSLGGQRGLIAAFNTKREVMLEADLEKIDPAIVLPYYMGSASGAAPSPGKITDGFGWIGIQAEGEPIAAGGSGILVWHSVPVGIYVDGDLKADGEEHASLKLHVMLYLGRSRGLWSAAARPVAA